MDLLRKAVESAGASTLVEVGTGMGAASWRLAQGRTYVGYEPDRRSFEEAVRRLQGLPGVRLENGMLPDEPDREFDALVALEVLEHLEDDHAALEGWSKWVAPGGWVVVSVPAHRSRFGPMDTAVGHYRRYERDELRSLMEKVGLTDIKIRAYGMPIGYLLEWVRNRFLVKRVHDNDSPAEGTAASGRTFQPRSGPRIISLAMLPFRWIQKPFERTELGIGWVAWGRKPV
jgi:SAM-dependent methyltransferase